MSGHNKWSKIKRQKGIDDIKKGQTYTKITREIIMAVRESGPNPDGNFRLRLAMQKARDANMPTDNVERAIKKGSGELGGQMVEMTLEGYGPGGAAIMVQALSDNRNRTLQEVRNVFTRHAGNLAETGSVAYLFEYKGIITIDVEDKDVDALTLEVIDAGADDVQVADGSMEVYTKPTELAKVRTELEKKKLNITNTDLIMAPKTTVEVKDRQAEQAVKLLDGLEELDDVQKVTTNADFPDSVLQSA